LPSSPRRTSRCCYAASSTVVDKRARAHWDVGGVLPGFGDKWSYWTTLTHGIPAFFTPNPLAHAGDGYPVGADHAGYYSTAPLESTLAELVDFDLINREARA
jgi:hypothetical protein